MKQHSRAGFTIVELLIVVVVIAILAAITLVAFNGITQRAKSAAAMSAAQQAAKKVATYTITNSDQVPPDLATAGITDSNGTTYQYSSNSSSSPQTFCITATANNLSYYIDNGSNTNPTLGACPGHGSNGVAAITNLVVNPSVEANATGWNVANGAVCNRQPSAALVGSWGMNCTTTSNVDSGTSIPAPGTYSAGTAYTFSFKIRSNSATTYTYMLSIQGAAATGGACSGGSGTICSSVTLASGQSATITLAWTPNTSGALVFYALRRGGQGTGSASFDVDGGMVTAGANTPNYADGNSQNWVWNGTINNSTSTGSPL